MFTEERRLKLLDYLGQHNTATVTQLCEAMKVSPVTIRSDLQRLSDANLLVRTRGGAMANTRTGVEHALGRQDSDHVCEKRFIAASALRLIEDKDVIILDGGTTTLEIARLLGQRKNVTVVTSDLLIALALADIDAVKVILIGGILRKDSRCTVFGRPLRGEFCAGLSVHQAFLSADGFSIEKGASASELDLAEAKKAMLSAATKVIMVCDSSKIGHDSLASFAPLEAIHTLVTDKISSEMRAQLAGRGLAVITPS
jgi:DeoR family transcriptional regulator, fructose operon transcriptional repressor